MSKRILVVEDEEDSRKILRDLLSTAAYEMTEAENGEQAPRPAISDKDQPRLCNVTE